MTVEPKLLWYPECDITFVQELDQMRVGDGNFFDNYVSNIHQQQQCPYCGATLTRLSLNNEMHTQYFQELSSGADSIYTDSEAFSCTTCNWLALQEHSIGDCKITGMLEDDISIHWGKIKEFAVAGSDVPINALRRHLSKHPEHLHSLNPKVFEKLVASCFSDFFNCEAIHVGGPGDDGIDVVLLDAERPILVQVKRREDPRSSEGVKVVRELLGVLLIHGRFDGIVVSTAERFSRAARETANRPLITNMGYRIELYNYSAVIEVLERTLKLTAEPWSALLRRPEC